MLFNEYETIETSTLFLVFMLVISSLQECCNSPYGNEYFADYAESIPGESTEAYSQAAKDNNVFLVAGTSVGDRELGGHS